MKSIKTVEEELNYAKRHDKEFFIRLNNILSGEVETYNEMLRTNKEHFIRLIDYFKIDLKNKNILELGPGWGDFLFLSRENGADKIEFIDYHPYYFTYNRLNGFNGYVNDYFTSNAFKGIDSKYDFIMSRGSINVDRFERQFNGTCRLISFPIWMIRLEASAKPGALIIICPTFDLGDDKEHPYKCDKEKFIHSKVYDHLVSTGYKVCTEIDGFTDPIYFPFVFYKII